MGIKQMASFNIVSCKLSYQEQGLVQYLIRSDKTPLNKYIPRL